MEYKFEPGDRVSLIPNWEHVHGGLPQSHNRLHMGGTYIVGSYLGHKNALTNAEVFTIDDPALHAYCFSEDLFELVDRPEPSVTAGSTTHYKVNYTPAVSKSGEIYTDIDTLITSLLESWYKGRKAPEVIKVVTYNETKERRL